MEINSSTKQASPKAEFEGLLEEFSPSRPRRGKLLFGTVVRVDDDAILFDVGAKRDGILNKYEMARTDPSLLEALKPGERAPLCVLRTPIGSEPLEVSIERARHVVDWERARSCKADDEIIQVRINGSNRGGLTAAMGRLRAFIPNSQVPALRRVPWEKQNELKRKLVGATMPVKIIEVNQAKNRLVCSARKAQSVARLRRLKELKKGDVVEGIVVNIVDFGAFVDIGGVDGLLHISEIAHKRIEHPSDALEPFQRLELYVKSANVETERISLSLKALIPPPGAFHDGPYEPGDLVKAHVIRRDEQGVFVRLSNGTDGIIKPHELAREVNDGTNRSCDPGEHIVARIVAIDRERESLELSMRTVSNTEEHKNRESLDAEGQAPDQSRVAKDISELKNLVESVTDSEVALNR
ncbi:MAG: S1 RNA-binding domain-containing protein [Anaerolineales bacterium]